MAWFSVGNSNEDLVEKMCGHGVMVPGRILDAFRHTDRGDFVQQANRLVAITLFCLYVCDPEEVLEDGHCLVLTMYRTVLVDTFDHLILF